MSVYQANPPRTSRAAVALDDKVGRLERRGSGRHWVCEDERGWNVQQLVSALRGITAADYLTWMRDPEPLALGAALRRVMASADPLGDRIELELHWSCEPPPPEAAAALAGFPNASAVSVTLH